MWSYPENSTKAIPLHLEELSFCVRHRTEMGFREAKCEVMETWVAVKGRLPGW
jgi:hypothetical protein